MRQTTGNYSIGRSGARAVTVFVALFVVLAAFAARADQALPYVADFEEPTYAPDATIHGIDGWTANDPTSATIQGTTVYSRLVALLLKRGGVVDQLFNSTDSAVWVDSYYRGAPIDVLPDLATLTSGSALVAFTQSSGIICLNGNGSGGGAWAQTGIQIDPSRWYRVSLRIDYATHNYDIHVNGVLRKSGMGFLYNTGDQLRGFRYVSGDTHSFLDHLSVSAVQPPHLTSIAAGDRIRMIVDYLTGASSPADARGLDANNDGKVDGADVVDRVNVLTTPVP